MSLARHWRTHPDQPPWNSVRIHPTEQQPALVLWPEVRKIIRTLGEEFRNPSRSFFKSRLGDVCEVHLPPFLQCWTSSFLVKPDEPRWLIINQISTRSQKNAEMVAWCCQSCWVSSHQLVAQDFWAADCYLTNHHQARPKQAKQQHSATDRVHNDIMHVIVRVPACSFLGSAPGLLKGFLMSLIESPIQLDQLHDSRTCAK